MKRIAVCDFELIFHDGRLQSAWILNQSELKALLVPLDVELVVPRCKVNDKGLVEPNLEKLLIENLQECSAALGYNVPLLFQSNVAIENLRFRLKQGLRLWLVINGSINQDNDPARQAFINFLDEIGITPTRIGLFSKKVDFDHPRSFLVERQFSPAAFRDPLLFKNTLSLTFTQAHALSLHGPAQAIVAVDPRRFNVVDMKSDYIFDWYHPDFPLMAISYIGDNGGCVIVSSGFAIANSYNGAMGHHFPGAKSNATSLSNILRFLTRHNEAEPPTTPDYVHRLIQTIERNILDIVRIVLGKNGADWRAFISIKAREKALARQASEGVNQIDWTAYLDLADHINTFGINAEKFRNILTALDMPTSRNKIEKDLFKSGHLIKIRILDSHITKRLVTEQQYSPNDLDVLDSVNTSVLRIWSFASSEIC